MARETTRLGLPARSAPLVRAAAVLGLGLGAFFDGIAFHQVLQWHHMLSSHPDPSVARDLPLNLLWDGLFNALAYLLTGTGVALLWRTWRRTDVPPSGRALFGGVLTGWGLFFVVEGLLNHQLLGIHHVWPAGPGGRLLWDLAYLASGAALVAAGLALARRAPR